MNTLQATPDARRALDRKKLQDRLNIVAGRAEALPHLSLGGMLSGAANRLNLLQFQACADILDDVDDRIERHQQALREADEQARADTLDQHLAENQGVETFKIGSVRSRDGWVWLKSRKDRITSVQASTGDQYARLYSLVERDGLSSCVNDNLGGAGGEDPIEARIKARDRLSPVRQHITAATGSDRLVNLLDSVCGRGETLRSLAGGDDRKAGAYEVELRLALDMAGVAFKGGKREEAA